LTGNEVAGASVARSRAVISLYHGTHGRDVRIDCTEKLFSTCRVQDSIHQPDSSAVDSTVEFAARDVVDLDRRRTLSDTNGQGGHHGTGVGRLGCVFIVSENNQGCTKHAKFLGKDDAPLHGPTGAINVIVHDCE